MIDQEIEAKEFIPKGTPLSIHYLGETRTFRFQQLTH